MLNLRLCCQRLFGCQHPWLLLSLGVNLVSRVEDILNEQRTLLFQFYQSLHGNCVQSPHQSRDFPPRSCLIYADSPDFFFFKTHLFLLSMMHSMAFIRSVCRHKLIIRVTLSSSVLIKEFSVRNSIVTGIVLLEINFIMWFNIWCTMTPSVPILTIISAIIIILSLALHTCFISVAPVPVWPEMSFASVGDHNIGPYLAYTHCC